MYLLCRSYICSEDKQSHLAYFNGLVFPQLDYANTIWGDQPGLTSEMQQLQAFQNQFAKKIAGGKFPSAKTVALLNGFQFMGGALDIYECNQGRCSRTL